MSNDITPTEALRSILAVHQNHDENVYAINPTKLRTGITWGQLRQIEAATMPDGITPNALDVQCPFCSARKGEFCRTPNGITRPAHTARKALI